MKRGIAARQRSRYLRFARPPQEKQLIAARTKTMKEKKFIRLATDIFVSVVLLLLLLFILFRKFVVLCQIFLMACLQIMRRVLIHVNHRFLTDIYHSVNK